MKKRSPFWLCFVVLIVLFAAVFFVSFLVGRYRVPAGQTLRLLVNRVLGLLSGGRWSLAPTWSSQEYSVVVNIRLPRILAAALIGAALSAAGTAYQAMFRNPMVSPDLLGASTGAGFGAALAILLGLGSAITTVSSFVFGLLAVSLTYLVGQLSRIRSTLAMVLAGVMVGSLFSAGTSFIKLVADTADQLPAITYWLMGALTSVKLDDLHFVLVPILSGLLVLFFLRWRLNLLTVSEAEARSMGVHTTLMRLIVIVCATLVTSASVCISGMIGWVGLVIPHICRLLVGQDTRRLLPASMLLGASFLMLVDDLARCLTTSEIPLGILTSFVGAPLFLYLIIKGGLQRADRGAESGLFLWRQRRAAGCQLLCGRRRTHCGPWPERCRQKHAFPLSAWLSGPQARAGAYLWESGTGLFPPGACRRACLYSAVLSPCF